MPYDLEIIFLISKTCHSNAKILINLISLFVFQNKFIDFMVFVLTEYKGIIANFYVHSHLYKRLLTALRFHSYNSQAPIHMSMLLLFSSFVVVDQVSIINRI